MTSTLPAHRLADELENVGLVSRADLDEMLGYLSLPDPGAVEAHDCRYVVGCLVCGQTLDRDEEPSPVSTVAAAAALESAWSAALAAFRLALVSAKAAGMDTEHEEAYVGQVFDPSCRMFYPGSVDTYLGWFLERLRGGDPYGDSSAQMTHEDED